MSEHILVSVCIPTYNYGQFLPDAMESVLNQTFKEFELIVVDNCSSDDTKNIVTRYSVVDNRINYYLNKTNVGLVENFNCCLKYAKGKYIKILSADDVLEPTCIEKSVGVLDCYPNVELVSVARLLTTENLYPIGTITFSDKFEVISGPASTMKCLLYGNLIGEPSSVLFRRESAGHGFNTTYKQLADLEMWYRLLEIGALAIIPETLCKIRKHEAQETNMNVKSFSFADEEFNLLNSYIKKDYVTFSIIERQLARYRRALGIWIRGYPLSYTRTLYCIAKHYNLPLFLILLGLNKFKSLIGITVKQPK